MLQIPRPYPGTSQYSITDPNSKRSNVIGGGYSMSLETLFIEQ